MYSLLFDKIHYTAYVALHCTACTALFARHHIITHVYLGPLSTVADGNVCS